jgi:hypothetical protein
MSKRPERKKSPKKKKSPSPSRRKRAFEESDSSGEELQVQQVHAPERWPYKSDNECFVPAS